MRYCFERTLVGPQGRSCFVSFWRKNNSKSVPHSLGAWTPNFTLFSNEKGPQSVVTGFHWFERPDPYRGPALGAIHFADAARLAARRHAEIWEQAHDKGSTVWSILSKGERGSRPADRSPS